MKEWFNHPLTGTCKDIMWSLLFSKTNGLSLAAKIQAARACVITELSMLPNKQLIQVFKHINKTKERTK